MRAKRILVLGANRYNVLSIRAARDAGFFVLAADWDPDAPGLAYADVGLPIDVTHCDELLAAVARCGGVDGVVSRAEVGVVPAAQMCRKLRLPSISLDSAASATSKAAMRRQWSKLRRWNPRFVVVSTEKEALKAVARLGKYPLIVKPDRSLGGSRGVSRVEDGETVLSAFRLARREGLPKSDVVIESCVTGSEHSAEVLIWNGHTSVLCISEKVKSRVPYRVDVSVQYPASLASEQEKVVAEMCDEAVRSLGLTQGVAHIEFAYTAEGPVLFELGARCGGGVTPQLTRHVSKVDAFVEACRMACGEPPRFFRPAARRGADYRFLIFPPGKVVRSQSVEALRLHPGVLDAEVTVKGGDEVLPLKSTSDRCGFVATVGSTRAEAVALADRLRAGISLSYADGRTVSSLALRDLM